MSASEYGDHIHRSPAQRHLAKRKRADLARQRKRADRMRQQQQEDRERAERATPSPLRCVCLPHWCLGVPGQSSACTACLSLPEEAGCPAYDWRSAQ